MNKTACLLSCMLFLNLAYGQGIPGKIKIVAEERTKEGKKLIVNDTVYVVLNTMKELILVTDAEGSVIIPGLPAGAYDVSLGHRSCQARRISNVIIGEGKTAYITMPLICASYLNSLSRKEKKKLGYN